MEGEGRRGWFSLYHNIGVACIYMKKKKKKCNPSSRKNELWKRRRKKIEADGREKEGMTFNIPEPRHCVVRVECMSNQPVESQSSELYLNLRYTH